MNVKCRAKNPATCRTHGTPVAATPEQQIVHLAQTINNALPKPEPKIKNPAINQAFNSNLTWDGEKPEWWENYNEKIENHPLLPCTPELLDIIDTPDGKLAVVWQTHSHSNSDIHMSDDSGYLVSSCHYMNVETGKTVGYIKTSSITEEMAERSFGKDEFTPFRWADRYSGRNYGFRNYDNDDEPRYAHRNLQGEELQEKRRQTWLKYNQNRRGSFLDKDGRYLSSVNLKEEHIPDNKTVNADIKTYTKELNKDVKDKKAYFKTPFVDFSNLNDELQGKGYGTALYIYTAKRLAQQGQVLRGSGVQSDEAQNVWTRFKKLLPNNTKKINLTYHGEKSTSYTLDFRK